MSYSREEFEQAFLNQYTDFERFENGEYMDDFLQQSWIGWQARAKTDACCSEIPNSCEPVYFYQEPEAVGSNKWREVPGRTLERQRQQSHFRGFKHRTLYTHPASAAKQAVSVPSILYDGYAVFQEVQHARNSKGLKNIKDSALVSDVLDAVVKLIKQEQDRGYKNDRN